MRKTITSSILLSSLALAANAQDRPQGRIAPEAVYKVAPPFGAYTDEVLFGEVWPDGTLSARDRSLVTVAALIASGNSAQVRGHTARALDNGVLPEEIAEMLAHLAFYAGWPVTISSVFEVEKVFADRGVEVEIDTSAPRLAQDVETEAARAAAVDRVARPVASNLADDTDEVLFADLWLRPGIAPRDRSMVTMAALIAMGQAEQLPFHLNRAIDNGMSKAEAGEMVRHLAYYTGWPRAFSAVPVLNEVFVAKATDSGRDDGATKIVQAPLGVVRGEDGETLEGSEENFTGTVTVGPLFSAPEPAALGGGIVHFEPGAYTAWHTHPLGQTLYVTEGCAWVQSEGNDIIEAGPGDFIQIPPNVRHWHGASEDSAMTHLALLESMDGTGVTWMEKVDPAVYADGPANSLCDNDS